MNLVLGLPLVYTSTFLAPLRRIICAEYRAGMARDWAGYYPGPYCDSVTRTLRLGHSRRLAGEILSSGVTPDPTRSGTRYPSHFPKSEAQRRELRVPLGGRTPKSLATLFTVPGFCETIAK